eukprot:4887309-Pleurochrysis_carterae.AAC.2
MQETLSHRTVARAPVAPPPPFPCPLRLPLRPFAPPVPLQAVEYIKALPKREKQSFRKVRARPRVHADEPRPSTRELPHQSPLTSLEPTIRTASSNS